MSALCAACGELVDENRRLAHVYRSHVKEKLFTCPGCNYHSTFDYQDVRSHIDKDHPVLSIVGVVDQTAIYHKLIDHSLEQCFPGCNLVPKQIADQTKFIKIESPKEVILESGMQRRSQRIPARRRPSRLRLPSVSPEPPLTTARKRQSSKITMSDNSFESNGHTSAGSSVSPRRRKSEPVATKNKQMTPQSSEMMPKRGRRSTRRFSPSEVKSEVSSVEMSDQSPSRRYPRRENATCLVIDRSPTPGEPKDEEDFDSPKLTNRRSYPKKNRPNGLTPLNARYFAPKSHPNQKRGADRFCFECNKIVKGSTRHIYNYHLKQPLFRCPLCPHFSTYDKQSVQDHIGRIHEGKGLAIDCAELYQKEMAEWNYRCWWSKDAAAITPKDAASSNEDDEKKSFTEKIFCHVCQAGVHRLKKQHILEVHVKKPLYVCPHCEFFSVSSKQRVNRHARTKHPGEGPSLSAVDRETEYHQLIVEWERKCFPDDYKHEEPKSPSLAAKIGRRPPSTRSAVKIAFKWKPRRLRNSLAQQMPITNRHDTAPSTSHSKRPTSYCRLCSTQVPMPRIVHLYRDHLKRPLFKCPHCPFYSTYAKYRVNKHISNIHRNEPDKEVIDLLRDQSVLEEIAKLEAACWRLSNGYENEVKTAALDDRESDVRQVECLLCMEKVSSRMQQLHIYKDHLKVDDLFYCTKCGFKSSFNSNAVRRHVARLHADGEGYASRITDYVHKLVELEDSCFPVEHSPARRQQKLWAPCQQCGQSVMMCRRPMHVLIDHVNVADMFACRYCDIKSCYKRSYVTRHSRKQHNDVNIHSRMEEFQEVVEKQTKLCFPLAQKPSTRFIGLAKSGLSTSHCSVCNKEQTEGAAHHIRRAHLPPLFKSTACPFTTYSFVQVQDHVRNHHAHVFQTGGQVVINNSAKYAAEFAKAHKMCFDESKSNGPSSPKRRKRIAVKKPLAGSTCQLCLNQVQKSDRLHHIYEVHLAADDLFKCAECNFASGCSLEQVANHMKAQHARRGEVLSRVEVLSWKISQFETACYSPNSNRLSRQCNTAFIIKNFCTALSRACKVCGGDKRIDRSRMKEHIWKHHLPTLPFCCAYCAENRFELRAIRDHVAKYHKSETPIDPPYTDKFEEMKEDMIQQFIECFGD